MPKTVKVLFSESYTVQNADGTKYVAGGTYEMSEASAKHFLRIAKCTLVDDAAAAEGKAKKAVPPASNQPATDPPKADAAKK